MKKPHAAANYLSTALLLMAVAVASVPSSAQDPDVNITTWGYDAFKTEQNLNEATLTPSAVKSTSGQNFGQLCNIQLDGQVYAQPLVVADVNFNGGSTQYASVAYVVTQNDTVYAINGTPQGTSPASCNASTTNQILGSKSLLTTCSVGRRSPSAATKRADSGS